MSVEKEIENVPIGTVGELRKKMEKEFLSVSWHASSHIYHELSIGKVFAVF